MITLHSKYETSTLAEKALELLEVIPDFLPIVGPFFYANARSSIPTISPFNERYKSEDYLNKVVATQTAYAILIAGHFVMNYL